MALILVVDDYPVTQRVLSYTLQGSQHRVTVASNGYEALERLAEDRFDLAIVDIAMPEMDGIELLRLVRASDNYSKLPVIMLTASGQDEDRQAARSVGVDEFLTKPASSRDVLSAVDRLLTRA